MQCFFPLLQLWPPHSPSKTPELSSGHGAPHWRHCAFEGDLTNTGVPPNFQPGIQVPEHPPGPPAIPQEVHEENLKNPSLNSSSI